jgi:hypothetical protein
MLTVFNYASNRRDLKDSEILMHCIVNNKLAIQGIPYGSSIKFVMTDLQGSIVGESAIFKKGEDKEEDGDTKELPEKVDNVV